MNEIRIDPVSKSTFQVKQNVKPEDKDVIATTTSYGVDFTSSIQKDNIFACQFHPEKSQQVGLQVLKNFGTLT